MNEQFYVAPTEPQIHKMIHLYYKHDAPTEQTS